MGAGPESAPIYPVRLLCMLHKSSDSVRLCLARYICGFNAGMPAVRYARGVAADLRPRFCSGTASRKFIWRRMVPRTEQADDNRFIQLSADSFTNVC
ncbi:hypothetical protein D3Z50_06530 [Clostridiaceae bacterium]|nr:hypothetical protein [Clostridiaceae bacterium]